MLAEQAEAPLEGPQQGALLDRLTVDRDNFLAALAWCEHAVNGAERGLRITVALVITSGFRFGFGRSGSTR